jgi:hypothetical protein
MQDYKSTEWHPVAYCGIRDLAKTCMSVRYNSVEWSMDCTTIRSLGTGEPKSKKQDKYENTMPEVVVPRRYDKDTWNLPTKEVALSR